MSTVQSYHPGSPGDQQAVFQLTLSNDLSIFNSHPAVWPSEKGPNGNSPTYWVGAGRLPHSVQHESINLSLYSLPRKPGIMEKRIIPYTHGWMPEVYLDEVVTDGKYLFGRLADTYVAIIGRYELEYIIPEELTKDGKYDPEGRREIIQRGLDTYWITEASIAAAEGSFGAFQNRIKNNHIEAGKDKLIYESKGAELALTFGKDFTVNGKIVNTEYKRFDSSYVTAERKPLTLEIKWHEKSLFLDFYNMKREDR
jgi:hypothetical protein